MGCRGWSFDDVLPYFRKSEDYKQGADPEYRGTDGPLKVEDYRTILPLTHRFIEGAQQAGYKFSKDLNGRQQEGVGYSQMTRKGKWRGSTAQTFLKEAQGRPNLRVETEALATKLLFEGKRCVGVAFRQRGKNDRSARRTRRLSCAAARSTRRICCRFPASDRRTICNRSAFRWCMTCAASARICRTITLRASRIASKDRSRSTSWHVASGWLREIAALLPRGPRRADLRRDHGAGVLPIDAGKSQPGSAASVHARQLRPEQIRRAGARGRHDGRGLPGSPGQPRHDHGAQSPIRQTKPVITPNYLSDPADVRVLKRRHAVYPRESSRHRRSPSTALSRRCPDRTSPPTTRCWITRGGLAPRSIIRSGPAAWARAFGCGRFAAARAWHRRVCG